MPYSSFTLVQVQRQFELNVVTGVFFADLPPLPPGDWLTNLLKKSAPLAATLGTEKVRAELIIAPLLFEFRELLNCQVSLFSGNDFSVDIDADLSGACDFLLTRSVSEFVIEAPAIAIVGANKGDFNAGWGQCAAEMVAAQKFNAANGKDMPTIFGSVTTGTLWQFLKLTGQDLTIDVTEYSLDPLDRILGILKWMVEGK
jgi:hypothetical protein